MPISNNYLHNRNDNLDLYDLKLMVCENCSFMQLSESHDPKIHFNDAYPYFSGYSKTWIEHCRNSAANLRKMLKLKPNDFVIELASNDGTFIKEFKKLKMKVLGIEPSANVAKAAMEIEIETINDFFTDKLSIEVLDKYGHPDLILGCNVLAHVPNLHSFILGVSRLMSNTTVACFEFPHASRMIQYNQFDTIYHEHYSYLTATSVSAMMRRHGLILIAVENIQTHGGSHRYWIMKHEKNLSFPIHSNAEDFVLEEKKWQISNIESWQETNSKMAKILDTHSRFLEECAINGLQVIGVGAAAKTTMFMNLLPGINLPKCVVDSSVEKQGRFIPGTTAQIVSLDSIEFNIANIFMIYAWNVEEELRKLIMQKFQSRSCLVY